MNESAELFMDVKEIPEGTDLSSDVCALINALGWSLWDASRYGYDTRNFCECRECGKAFSWGKGVNNGYCSHECFIKPIDLRLQPISEVRRARSIF